MPRRYKIRFPNAENYRAARDATQLEGPDFGPDDPNDPSLEDVLNLIDAPAAWQDSTGKGITIAVVDTGIDGTRPEFPCLSVLVHGKRLLILPGRIGKDTEPCAPA